MTDILAVMRDHDLYRPRDEQGWPTCSCMTHYCDCDHEGFLQAYKLVESLLSDPSARLRSTKGKTMANVTVETFGGPVYMARFTLEDGTVIECRANSVPIDHGSFTPELSFTMSDPHDKVAP